MSATYCYSWSCSNLHPKSNVIMLAKNQKTVIATTESIRNGGQTWQRTVTEDMLFFMTAIVVIFYPLLSLIAVVTTSSMPFSTQYLTSRPAPIVFGSSRNMAQWWHQQREKVGGEDVWSYIYYLSLFLPTIYSCCKEIGGVRRGAWVVTVDDSTVRWSMEGRMVSLLYAKIAP